jgi:hypothetical protein
MEVPSVAAQKRFIVNNGALLDCQTSKTILSLLQLGLGQHLYEVLLTDSTNGDVLVNLDRITDENLVRRIYTVVHSRREALNQPAAE